MAIASEKINAKIIEIKIRGAAEGLRPKALMAANPTIPITNAGPRVVTRIMKTMVKVFMLNLRKTNAVFAGGLGFIKKVIGPFD